MYTPELLPLRECMRGAAWVPGSVQAMLSPYHHVRLTGGRALMSSAILWAPGWSDRDYGKYRVSASTHGYIVVSIPILFRKSLYDAAGDGQVKRNKNQGARICGFSCGGGNWATSHQNHLAFPRLRFPLPEIRRCPKLLSDFNPFSAPASSPAPVNCLGS